MSRYIWLALIVLAVSANPCENACNGCSPPGPTRHCTDFEAPDLPTCPLYESDDYWMEIPDYGVLLELPCAELEDPYGFYHSSEFYDATVVVDDNDMILATEYGEMTIHWKREGRKPPLRDGEQVVLYRSQFLNCSPDDEVDYQKAADLNGYDDQATLVWDLDGRLLLANVRSDEETLLAIDPFEGYVDRMHEACIFSSGREPVEYAEYWALSVGIEYRGDIDGDPFIVPASKSTGVTKSGSHEVHVPFGYASYICGEDSDFGDDTIFHWTLQYREIVAVRDEATDESSSSSSMAGKMTLVRKQ
ncbi:MAG: hypothetical protein H6684_04940 [Deltaproteobacteria bacterium]|nr:hypothetical protein [Deltaproteobacteria bacterium]MCB9488060.1 hypothetical protein [Deltaproteobacteria bacterium]